MTQIVKSSPTIQALTKAPAPVEPPVVTPEEPKTPVDPAPADPQP